MKIALAQINPTVGALASNCEKIVLFAHKAHALGANLTLFPEMALCGYPPEDLLLLPDFIDAVQRALYTLIERCPGLSLIVGTVRKGENGELFNSAAVIDAGELIGFHDKALLPNYDVFSESRYFDEGAPARVWRIGGVKVGVTICEDLWQHSGACEKRYERDPLLELKKEHPSLLVNLSASPFYKGRLHTRINVCQKGARALECPVFLCNQVGGNDGLIFDGRSLALSKEGEVIALGKAFEETLLITAVSGESIELPPPSIHELFDALVLGVRDYFHKQGFSKACLGLSGGIDSAVVAVIAKEALGSENILTVLMPSRFTSKASIEDARLLAKGLHLPFKELSIEPPFELFLSLLEEEFQGAPFDHTEENIQARIRALLLMAFSNKQGSLLLSTGNKSEMAMGYSTLYGDLAGALGVLSDVTKQEVYALARLINEKEESIPKRILEKAPSAELKENQSDQDTLPPYSIIDQVLKSYVEDHLSPSEIAKSCQLDRELVDMLIEKIHKNEFKRQQAPLGLKVTKRAFSMGRRFPIVQKWHPTEKL